MLGMIYDFNIITGTTIIVTVIINYWYYYLLLGARKAEETEEATIKEHILAVLPSKA